MLNMPRSAKGLSMLNETMNADGSDQDRGKSVHRIPVIDKMLDILDLLHGSEEGESIGAICDATGVPRSTVYRILNTLAARGIVGKLADGRFRLGFRLITLAQGVRRDMSRADLLKAAHPVLAELAAQTGETCKLSVVSDDRAEVVDVVQSSRDMAPTSRVGSTFAMHAGAASKLLLAFAPPALVERVLSGELERFTAATMADPAVIRAALADIRAEGISRDRGEWNVAVHALAAPVFGFDGTAIAAISVTYFAQPDSMAQERRIMPLLIAASQNLSKSLGAI
jgi:DNA-binding IclR family transcriptional regulator